MSRFQWRCHFYRDSNFAEGNISRISIIFLWKVPSQQAHKPQIQDSSKLSPTDRHNRIDSRNTSVSQKACLTIEQGRNFFPKDKNFPFSHIFCRVHCCVEIRCDVIQALTVEQDGHVHSRRSWESADRLWASAFGGSWGGTWREPEDILSSKNLKFYLYSPFY